MKTAPTRKPKAGDRDFGSDIQNLRLLIERMFAETQGVEDVDDLRKLLETISRSLVRLVQLTQMQTATAAEAQSGEDEIRKVLDEIVAAKRRGECSRLPGVCGRAKNAKVEAPIAETTDLSREVSE